MLKLEKMKNYHGLFFNFLCSFSQFSFMGFFSPKKNKMLSQTSQEKPNIRRSIPDNGAKNLM